MEGLTAHCSAVLEAQLVACIQENLSQYLYDNARWLAERLVALSSNEFNINLLALCYYHSNQAYRSYHLLKNAGVTSPSARYLLASCCVQLGRLHEARNALKQGTQEVPCGAAGRYLLARVCHMSGDNKEAKEHLVAALRLNPLMWCAFEDLCALGGDKEAQEICSLTPGNLQELLQQHNTGMAADTEPGDCEATDQNQAGSSRGGGMKAVAASPSGKRPASQQPDSATPLHILDSSGHVGCVPPGAHNQGGLVLSHAGTDQTPAAAHHLDAAAFTSGPAAQVCGAATGAPQVAGRQGQADWLQCGIPAWQHPSPGAWSTPSCTTPSIPGAATAHGAGSRLSGLDSVMQQQQHTPGGEATPSDWPPQLMQPEFPPSFLASTPSTSEDTQGHGGPGCMTGVSGPGQLGAAPDSINSLPRGAAAPGRGAADEFSTPMFRGQQMHHLLHPRSTVSKGYPGEPSSTPSTCTPNSQSSFPPQLSGPPPAAARAMRLAMEDGRVRKVTGKSLFHEAPPPPPSAAAAAGGGGVAGGRCGSPSRRSSRLAALAGGAHTGTKSPTGPGGSRARGVGAARGVARYHPHVLTHRMGHNQADPAQAPPPPKKQQPVMDGKLFNVNTSSKRGPAMANGVVKHCGGDLMTNLAAASGKTQVHPHTQVPLCKTSLGQALCLHMLGPAYEGYRHMSMFRCQEALEALKRFPACQLKTPWVLTCMGRLLMERMEYHQAAAAFKMAHEADKQRVEGLEYYSTALWHLKRDTELAYLAQAALATDRLAPQSWVVLGNLFSLQKEHETALKLFERALQLNPEFTYAYTLSGHEYAAADELDKAQAAYGNALRTDPRHYNALYGLGSVHFRQEHYDMALLHFRKAAAISPRSSVLHCYVGMALARQGLLDKALDKMEEAIQLDPRNPLAHYEKANALVSKGDLAGALKEFGTLVHLAPGEASVYMQMGKLYKRLGRLGDAQRQLEMALSFATASGDAAAIKTAIDKLTVNAEEHEEEM